MLKFEQQLNSLLAAGPGSEFSQIFKEVELVAWKQLFSWMLATNSDFFRQHLEQVLVDQQQEYTHWLSASVSVWPFVPVAVRDLFESRFYEKLLATAPNESKRAILLNHVCTPLFSMNRSDPGKIWRAKRWEAKLA